MRRLLFLWAEIIRGIPLIFVIFWLWYLLPMLTGGDLPGAVTVTLALAWFTAASVMHSVLAGLQSLPKGQYEAALTQGSLPGKRCAWCCSRRRCATFSRRWWGSLSAC